MMAKVKEITKALPSSYQQNIDRPTASARKLTRDRRSCQQAHHKDRVKIAERFEAMYRKL